MAFQFSDEVIYKNCIKKRRENSALCKTGLSGEDGGLAVRREDSFVLLIKEVIKSKKHAAANAFLVELPPQAIAPDGIIRCFNI